MTCLAGKLTRYFPVRQVKTERALTDELTASEPGWHTAPSWFVYGEHDLNIPAQTVRFMAERASARATREIPGASHALALSQPGAVTAVILDAVDHIKE
ncbi:alpha/beta fold hydrolase [Nonomuraea insulae]|uniref:Alpha/beta fold hydrolase n=1 Tax=Nonomuraea insulae TaxID=1616787 RepID=A0ABW1CQ06_9ACTN